MIEDPWVVITKISGEFNGELLRGLLEAQGIPARLNEEGAGRAYGFSVGPLSEVEILVPKSKEEEAKQVIEHFEAGDFEAPEIED